MQLVLVCMSSLRAREDMCYYAKVDTHENAEI